MSTTKNAVDHSANSAKRIAHIAGTASAADGYNNSLVSNCAMTVDLGPVTAEEVAKGWPGCASPNVYASDFSRGYKASLVLGKAATLQLIREAAKKPGTAYNLVKAALKVAMEVGAARKKAGQTGPLAPKSAAKLVTAAVSQAARKLAAAKAAKKPGDKKSDAPTTAAEWVAQYNAIVAAGAKLLAPEGREAVWAAGMNDARKAGEAFSLSTKKLIKAK